MLSFIEGPDDVIALRVAHKISGHDLDAIMDRLDAVMAQHAQVHVFVETHAIDGLEIAGLAAYAGRAVGLLGQLNRFGRVAVVADQAWIRGGTRLESALLPQISYRVFTPDERDAALAWVQGAETPTLAAFGREASTQGSDALIAIKAQLAPRPNLVSGPERSPCEPAKCSPS